MNKTEICVPSVRLTYRSVGPYESVIDMPVTVWEKDFRHRMCLLPLHFMRPGWPRLQRFDKVISTEVIGTKRTQSEEDINFAEPKLFKIIEYWKN